MAERRARDLDLLDAIDAFKREPFSQPVRRVAQEGREPTLGAATSSRWCNGTFDVLDASLERDGALAEIHAPLASQPVFPSKVRSLVHKLVIDAKATLRLADPPTLARLGVDVARYRECDYEKTQSIADAAYFLGFDGLVAPSARWDCLNLALFTERIAPDAIAVVQTENTPVDWNMWRRSARK